MFDFDLTQAIVLEICLSCWGSHLVGLLEDFCAFLAENPDQESTQIFLESSDSAAAESARTPKQLFLGLVDE